MSRSPVWGRGWWLIGVGGSVGLAVPLAACGLNADLPHRSDGATPVSSGVMLSGVRTPDADAALGTGDDSLITDIKDGPGGGASATMGGIDSGGAPDESAGGIGGAASSEGGAAGAGGTAAKAGATHGGAGGTTSPAHAGASAAGAANAAPPTLYFSEYVEGSSAYKALEIAAQTRSLLDGCKVGTYFNGKTEATVVATLSGVLEAGKVLTLCSSSLQEKLGAVVCNQVGNLTFNGDDVIAISCGGTILDVIGQIGVDPGTAWGSDANSTLDHTLRRKCSVTGGAGSANSFDPSGEWQAFPVDTFDGLGTRGC